MSESSWKQYYEDNPPPSDLPKIKAQLIEFCSHHASNNTRVVLVTSGGTTVPLEHNTVRFVDNFSAGTRGSSSAEYFLKAGCAVIFLHRSKSLEPFVRHVPVSDLMESLVTEQAVDGNWSITVHGDLCNKLAEISNEYKRLCAKKMLIKIPFTTLSSYFHILYEASHALKPMGRNAILYLAAAVSDFYIPRQEMATHKISSDEELSLNLRMVPKLLQPLVRYWVPDAFVVSFKLETDESILISKARKALERYQHKLVIGNELNSRKYKVTLVTKTEEKSIILNQEEISEGKEIEEKIVEELFKYYEKL